PTPTTEPALRSVSAAPDEPAADGVDSLADLLAASCRQLRPSAGAPQLGVDDGMGLPGLGGIGRDQRVELLAMIGQRAVRRDPLGGLFATTPADLLALPVTQDVCDLL